MGLWPNRIHLFHQASSVVFVGNVEFVVVGMGGLALKTILNANGAADVLESVATRLPERFHLSSAIALPDQTVIAVGQGGAHRVAIRKSVDDLGN